MTRSTVRSRGARRVLATTVAAAMVLVACGSDDDAAPATTAAPATQDADDTDDADDAGATDDTDDAGATDEADDGGDTDDAVGVLAGVCPDPIVIQTDWFPESEHGALYELVGDDYVIDANQKTVRGTLVAGGVDTGIELEVRTGGPAIGFQPVSSQMYTDDDITMGYVSTDEAALTWAQTPTIAVVAPLERNPQIIMWDPETYPDVTSIADLGELGVTINVFAGGTYIEVFVNEGIVSADQIDPSYDGSPARFISEGGAIAQQGFASESPFSYEFVYEEWARPVAFELIHDAGLEVYSQPLVVRADDLEALTPCLELFVPMVQQAVVDYFADPARTNAMIVDVVEVFDDFWIYPPELAQFSVDTMFELGLVGNGPDSTVGNFEFDRVQGVIDQMTAAGMSVPADLTADTIATNDFIDPSIGFAD